MSVLLCSLGWPMRAAHPAAIEPIPCGDAHGAPGEFSVWVDIIGRAVTTIDGESVPSDEEIREAFEDTP